MSANPIYDTIEDCVLGALEQGAKLPREFDVRVEASQMKALLRYGLSTASHSKLDESTTAVTMVVADHWILVKSDSHAEYKEPH